MSTPSPGDLLKAAINPLEGLSQIGDMVGGAFGAPEAPSQGQVPIDRAPNSGERRVEKMEQRYRQDVRARAGAASVALASEDTEVVGAASRKLGRTSKTAPKLRALG